MFSLWWHENWIRFLVIAMSPIGFIDAVYTILLYNQHGAEFEYNPIVREALGSIWWPVWFILDVLSFSLFAMIAGSYYLHTRSRIFGVRTGWFAGLIAVRVAAAVYNVLLFYNPFIFNAIFIPGMGGVIAGVLTYFFVGGLLSRTDDVSISGFKAYLRSKYDGLHDRLLTRGLDNIEEYDEEEMEVEEPLETESSEDQYGRVNNLWLKRAGYLAFAAIVFVSVPYLLLLVVEVTGVGNWSDIYGPLVFFNELSSRSFLLAFVSVLALLAVMMYFVLKSFSVGEGNW
jgi:hypothetical protein